MKINTSELQGLALDYAVAKAEGLAATCGKTQEGTLRVTLAADGDVWRKYRPSTDWAQGGLIIDREIIQVKAGTWSETGAVEEWFAYTLAAELAMENTQDLDDIGFYGPTYLTAAMRCYVSMKLGNEIDVPSELLEHELKREGRNGPKP